MADSAVRTVFTGDAGPVTATIGKLMASLSRLSTAFKVGAAAMVAAGLAAKPMISTSIEFEDRMLGLQKLLGEDLAKPLTDSLLKLGTVMPIASGRLFEVAENAARLGIRGRKNLLDFTETMAMVETATDLTATVASEQFARIAEVTNLPISQIRNLASVANELSNTMATSFSEIVQSAGELAPALAQLKIPAERIFGIAAAVNEVNVSVRRGARRLRSFIQQMSDTKKVEGFARVLGITAEQYENLLSERPIKLLRMFTQAAAEGGERARALGNVVDQAAAQGILSLGQNLEGLVDALETSDREMEVSKSLIDEYGVFLGSTSSKQQLLTNRITLFRKEIGDRLKPAWAGLLNIALQWLDIINRIFDRPLRGMMKKENFETLRDQLGALIDRAQDFDNVLNRDVRESMGALSEKGLEESNALLEELENHVRRIEQVSARGAGLFLADVSKAIENLVESGKEADFKRIIVLIGDLATEYMRAAKEGFFASGATNRIKEILGNLGETGEDVTDVFEGLNEAFVRQSLDKFAVDVGELSRAEIDLLLNLTETRIEVREGEQAARAFRQQVRGMSEDVISASRSYEHGTERAKMFKEHHEELTQSFVKMREKLEEEIAVLKGWAGSSEEAQIRTMGLSDSAEAFLLNLVNTRDAWEEYHTWMIDRGERFHDAFYDRIQDL